MEVTLTGKVEVLTDMMLLIFYAVQLTLANSLGVIMDLSLLLEKQANAAVNLLSLQETRHLCSS